jgi:hypothetical protein
MSVCDQRMWRSFVASSVVNCQPTRHTNTKTNRHQATSGLRSTERARFAHYHQNDPSKPSPWRSSHELAGNILITKNTFQAKLVRTGLFQHPWTCSQRQPSPWQKFPTPTRSRASPSPVLSKTGGQKSYRPYHSSRHLFWCFWYLHSHGHEDGFFPGPPLRHSYFSGDGKLKSVFSPGSLCGLFYLHSI